MMSSWTSSSEMHRQFFLSFFFKIQMRVRESTFFKKALFLIRIFLYRWFNAVRGRNFVGSNLNARIKVDTFRSCLFLDLCTSFQRGFLCSSFWCCWGRLLSELRFLLLCLHAGFWPLAASNECDSHVHARAILHASLAGFFVACWSTYPSLSPSTLPIGWSLMHEINCSTYI